LLEVSTGITIGFGPYAQGKPDFNLMKQNTSKEQSQKTTQPHGYNLGVTDTNIRKKLALTKPLNETKRPNVSGTTTIMKTRDIGLALRCPAQLHEAYKSYQSSAQKRTWKSASPLLFRKGMAGTLGIRGSKWRELKTLGGVFPGAPLVPKEPI
jgi:hypothetical protein